MRKLYKISLGVFPFYKELQKDIYGWSSTSYHSGTKSHFYNNYLFFITNFMFKNILLKAKTTLILLNF